MSTTDCDSDTNPLPSKSSSSGYVITDALKAPRATTYTAQALFDQIMNGDIDLDPEYQRDIVWPEAKQVGLIDSIFRNFYIPPVIFSVNAHDDGSEQRVCIDGKQRLTSIYRFMLGLIYHHDRNSNAKFWYQDTQAGSKSCTLLPEKYRRLFSNKQIVCIEYMDINDRDEREIFQRVQLGMALTPAEKLAVIKSPRADFIRHLQLTFFKDSSSSLTTLAWDRSRGTDFRCLATILWCLDRFKQSPSLLANTGSIVQVESWLSSKQQSPSSQFKSDVTAGFSFLEAMLNSSDSTITSPFHAYDSGKASRKVQKVSPIEFICISLLVLIWHTKLSAKAIADAITRMRKAVRDEHVDVRMNTRVGGTMITFIKELAVIEPEPENEHEHEQDDPEARNRRYKSRSRSSKVMEASPTVQSCATRKRKRGGGGGEGEDPDVLSSSSTTGRLAEIRKVTQKYQESTVD